MSRRTSSDTCRGAHATLGSFSRPIWIDSSSQPQTEKPASANSSRTASSLAFASAMSNQLIFPLVGSTDKMYRRPVGYKRVKTEHAGAKNGSGAWMMRRRRRRAPSASVIELTKRWSREVGLDDWGDSDQFSARGSRGVLRHMIEDEEAAGVSWEKFRQHRGTPR